MLLSVACPELHIFPHYLIDGTVFRKRIFQHKIQVIYEKSAVLWEMIVCVILSKKVRMNMGPILNGYRDMVKRKYGPSCEHEQQLRNKYHHN